MGELQKTNNAQLEEMNEEIKSSVRNMQNNLNSVVKKARQETTDLVSSAKHGALVTNIIDALKYGAATSAITIPVLYLLLSYQKEVDFKFGSASCREITGTSVE